MTKNDEQILLVLRNIFNTRAKIAQANLDIQKIEDQIHQLQEQKQQLRKWSTTYCEFGHAELHLLDVWGRGEDVLKAKLAYVEPPLTKDREKNYAPGGVAFAQSQQHLAALTTSQINANQLLNGQLNNAPQLAQQVLSNYQKNATSNYQNSTNYSGTANSGVANGYQHTGTNNPKVV